MACAATPGFTDCVSDIAQAEYYHRTLSLHFDCGSEVLRRLIDSKLKARGHSLRQHLNDRTHKETLQALHKNGFLYLEQMIILFDPAPSLAKMDLTLLTVVLLKTFTTGSLKGVIEDLRTLRNKLAHVPNGALPDNEAFKSAKLDIIKIAESIGEKDHQDIARGIGELEKRKLFRSYNIIDRLQLYHEELTAKLIDLPKDREVDKATLIRFGLTKWVKQIWRSTDIPTLLQSLHKEGVVTFTERKTIEQVYSVEEQAHQLVMLMTNQREEQLLKLCRCLRNQNEDVANLIEQSNTGGEETECALIEIHKKKIVDCIGHCLRRKNDGSVDCCDVHILVEEELRSTVDFSIVDECVKEAFEGVTLTDKDHRYVGIAFTKEEESTSAVSEAGEEDFFTGMTSERFAIYIGRMMKDVREGLEDIVQNAFLEHSITAKIFIELNEEELSSILSDPLKANRISYGIGIRKSIIALQENVRRRKRQTRMGNECSLRPFDAPTAYIKYTKMYTVQPQPGNMIVPRHEFIHIPPQTRHKFALIVRETTRMVAACVNAAQNGTIHFGIESTALGCGKVIGVTGIDANNIARINWDLQKALYHCFKVSM